MSTTTEVRSLESESFDEGGSVERYEIWRGEQLVMMLDLINGEFSAEWFAPYTPNEFIQSLKRVVGVNDKSQAMAMCSIPDEEPVDRTLKGPLEAVVARDIFPEYCTYLEVQSQDSDLEFAWAEDKPSPTIIVSGSNEHFAAVERLFRDSLSERDVSSEAINEALVMAKEYLENDHSSESSGSFFRQLFKH